MTKCHEITAAEAAVKNKDTMILTQCRDLHSSGAVTLCKDIAVWLKALVKDTSDVIQFRISAARGICYSSGIVLIWLTQYRNSRTPPNASLMAHIPGITRWFGMIWQCHVVNRQDKHSEQEISLFGAVVSFCLYALNTIQCLGWSLRLEHSCFVVIIKWCYAISSFSVMKGIIQNILMIFVPY